MELQMAVEMAFCIWILPKKMEKFLFLWKNWHYGGYSSEAFPKTELWHEDAMSLRDPRAIEIAGGFGNNWWVKGQVGPTLGADIDVVLELCMSDSFRSFLSVSLSGYIPLLRKTPPWEFSVNC